ncbi:MAG TPA: MFS transporter, partial [Sphingomonas sp.]|nr:MFS transporter [Sphingomonas sp.]
MASRIETARPPATRLGRVVAASMIGTTIEWYDFFVYGLAAALVFNKLFFPSFDPLVGTLLAFATYALGFAARPVGGIVFGHFGDRIGRKRLLMLSLVLMGLSTALIGFLPSYDRIGIWAPLLLILLRLIQGFAVGGEWGGAVLLVSEHGDAARRGFWASWPQAGVPAGNLLAAGVMALIAGLVSDAAFTAWGWRIAFLLSVVLVAIGWWVRSAVPEPPIFEEQRAETPPSRWPGLDVLREAPRGLAIGAGLRIGENIVYYILTAFSVTYLTEVTGQGKDIALVALLIGAAAEFVAIPLFGILSDRIGRRPVYALGGFGLVAWIFAFFALLRTGSPAAIVVAVIGGLILHGAMYGPQAAFIAELFPTRLRYSGVSIAYQLTS